MSTNTRALIKKRTAFMLCASILILSLAILAILGVSAQKSNNVAFADDSASSLSATQVEITLEKTGESAGVASLDKSIYTSDEDVVLNWKGTTSGFNFIIPQSITYNNRTISLAQLLPTTSIQKTNSEYKRRMGEAVTMADYDLLESYVKNTHAVNLGKMTLNTTVTINFVKLAPTYRLYNMISSEHLFTNNRPEYEAWVTAGKENADWWIGEGISWLTPTTTSGTTKIHRLYNKGLGALQQSSHYYTSDTKEINSLVKNSGWKDEGDEFVIISGGSTPIYTCYNESLKSAHHYTSNKTEWQGLEKHGWDLEKKKNGNSGVFKCTMGTSWSTSSNYYIVQHQLQQTNGSYSTYETQVVAGKSGSTTAAVAKSYEGYVAQSITQQTIKANNSTVIAVKYDTKPYKITYSGNGQTLSTATYSYGQTIADPGDPNVENFDFDGWYWDSSFTKPFEFGSATMPSKNITIYAKLTGAVNFSVSFDTMGHGEMPERQQVSIGGFATQPDDPVAESYRFDGWYADEHCVQEWDFLNDRIYADTIIYAKWTILAKDYWLAPASRITNEDKTNVVNPNYVNPETGVIRTHDEILADAELIKDGDNPTKLTYEDYMASDSIHLYTKIGEGTSEDDYMEFRIVNVGGHLCSGGIVDESDETGLTFQAIHALPEAYTVNATQTNEGGWLSSTLRSEMNSEGGSIYALFNEQLKTDAAKVKKYSRNGSAASTPSDTVGNGRDKFWLMSYCETVGDPMSGWLNHNMEDEGDQYGYWQMMRPVNSGENKALLPLALTRSGNIVANATTQYAGSFWTRSSLPGDTRSFCYFNNSGNAEGMTANIKLAVTPCFAL